MKKLTLDQMKALWSAGVIARAQCNASGPAFDRAMEKLHDGIQHETAARAKHKMDRNGGSNEAQA